MKAFVIVLVVMSLLGSSAAAVAHVDGGEASTSVQHATHAGVAAPVHDDGAAPGHCDVCSHGLSTLATAVVVRPSWTPAGAQVFGAVPAFHAAVHPDRQDRPPK